MNTRAGVVRQAGDTIADLDANAVGGLLRLRRADGTGQQHDGKEESFYDEGILKVLIVNTEAAA